ncbi:Uncharacterized protein OBRU01_07387, partial [Operophtera brumata]
LVQMDGSTVDHSDSDSGESWTLLENQPAYGDDAPDFSKSSPASSKREDTEALLENDEDTDGISIISDSDPESSPYDINLSPCGKCSSSENRLSRLPDAPNLLKDSQPPNKKTIESCAENDFLGDGSHKIKTYVHRRNKRLSTVLNIIMLGSVITAAGVAIGHIWGAKNECAAPTPSVNKILSNLYKLQEENAYLRNQLNEFRTLASNIHQMQQLKASDRKLVKQQRCKKVFEEPLDNKVEKAFKCVDHDSNESVKMLDNSELLYHEKEFLNDISKLKNVYNQNKSWLDDYIQRKLAHDNNFRNKQNLKEDDSTKANKDKEQINFNWDNEIGPTFKLPNQEQNDASSQIPNKYLRIPENKQLKNDKGNNSSKAWNMSRETDATNKVDNIQKHEENYKQDIKLSKAEKKISYADSLKTDSDTDKVYSQINDTNKVPIKGMQGSGQNRRYDYVDLMLNLISSSEDEIKKDDRYIGPKIKRDKKKHDRHKIHKKQKRKNKYEQWEMKGGYMKDFDEFSMTSSQFNLGNNIKATPEKKYLNHDSENYLSKLTEADDVEKTRKSEENVKPEQKGEEGKNGKSKDSEWYNKRCALRAEARRKLEYELFGESSLNNAAWYFRRMNKREQCRALKDNSTYKKFSKHHQKMNFKMKHGKHLKKTIQ